LSSTMGFPAIVPKWSEADFVKTIRSGVNPTGHSLDPDKIPWKDYAAFANDNDLKAIYAYLQGLTPIVKLAK
jgi:hypothetical protein